MRLEDKGKQIIKDIKSETGTSPIRIFKNMAHKDYIAIHGPEHHVLDGASLLVACKNAGMEINLDESLNKLLSEGLRMPVRLVGRLRRNHINRRISRNYRQYRASL